MLQHGMVVQDVCHPKPSELKLASGLECGGTASLGMYALECYDPSLTRAFTVCALGTCLSC